MSLPSRVPIIALVGRPNVGKSRLFNRFTGHRRALVENTPGITRDRIAEEIEVLGRRVLLVDTAGLDPEPESPLHAAIQAQARSAVEQADAILFILDGQAGLLPEDEEIARTLRRGSKPIALAVNKLDTHQHADRLLEFYSLGMQPLRAVSAEHGLGAFDVLEELVELLPPEQELPELPDEESIRIAFVGRPNVGKSTLVNRLLGEERVVVSDVPGTTRDSVDMELEHDDQRFVLVDTAGLRKPGRRTRTAERGSALMTVRSLERAQVAFLLVDAADGFSEQDARIASLIEDRGCAVGILANKWDDVATDQREKVREEIRHGLRFLAHSPLLAISAAKGTRVGRILPLARELHSVGRTRITTPDLNRWLQEAVAKHEPSMARKGYSKRPIKFFYATQIGVRPPRFVLFCTEPGAIKTSYRRFLENRLRETFGFEGTPIRLILRARKR